MNSLPVAPEPQALKVGLEATVEAPATSANLGPGFDSLGIALSWTDTSFVRTTESGFTFDLSGPGTASLAKDESHLVVRTILDALQDWGLSVPGLHFQSRSTIPLARGLGSSSAAIVSGLLLAWALAKPGVPVDKTWAFRRAFGIEGHGDNVGPAVMGGFTLTWSSTPIESGGYTPQICCSPIREDIRALALIPDQHLETDCARAALPKSVPLSDAISNSARSALLVHALAHDPGLLFEATLDHLHQDYRAQLAPESHRLLVALREQGFAAVISGAGPTVLVLHCEDQTDDLLQKVRTLPQSRGFTAKVLSAGHGARILS